MPLKYKVDVLAALKEAGYSTYKLRKEKIFGEATIQKMRACDPVSLANVEALCKLLGCQPGNLLEYVPDEGGNAE